MLLEQQKCNEWTELSPLSVRYNGVITGLVAPDHMLLYKINQQNAPFLNQYFNFYDVSCTYSYSIILYHTCTYKRLPKDEPSCSKHVEDTIKN